MWIHSLSYYDAVGQCTHVCITFCKLCAVCISGHIIVEIIIMYGCSYIVHMRSVKM